MDTELEFQEVLETQKQKWKREDEETVVAATPIAAAIIADLKKRIEIARETGEKLTFATESWNGDFSLVRMETLNQVHNFIESEGLYVDREIVSEDLKDLEYAHLSVVIMNSSNEPVQSVGSFHKTARARSYQRNFARWVAQQWPDEHPARYRACLVPLTGGEAPRRMRARLT